ncbi:MAG: hypothetical protein SGI92_22860 [Bryobacteraceae bacterium]|nr:hypothetical protein [Bryobacteraceae bacterium]
MTPVEDLTAALALVRLDEAEVREKQSGVELDVLRRSGVIRVRNFSAIGASDLQLLFRLYDDSFLGGRMQRALGDCDLRMRLAARMTKTGGTTSRFRVPTTGAVFFEIAIATSVLFESFSRPDDREVTVTGIVCKSRLEALQRIFEHELVHLMENLCFGSSQCSAARFQDIAARLFGHTAHTHQLITRRERAAVAGIVNGAWVEFTAEGRKYRGRVRRVTKRATVLVEDPSGEPYSDGKRYRTWYVPLAGLRPMSGAA